MKEVLNFINDNAILASLITLTISTIIQIIFRISDRKYNDKKDRIKVNRREYENKAELLIDNNMEDDGTILGIKLFMTDFDAHVSKEEVIFNYRKDVLNSKKYKHLIFYIKNIGNADINQLDICVTNQKHHMLCQIDSLKTVVKNNVVNYSYCFDRKIMKGKAIKIDIAYLEDSKIFHLASSELVLLFRDSYNNLYQQPFFIEQKNLYEPYKIKEEDYRIHVTTDTALECFKNPWMW